MTDNDIKNSACSPVGVKRLVGQALATISCWNEAWDGKVCVSFSGGLDSTVLLDLARKVNPDIIGIFAFTGLEYPEVLEHVSNPYRFIGMLKSHLKNNGIILITVPNGYGCFEIMAILVSVLNITQIWPSILRIRSFFSSSKRADKELAADTLAVSPHINFFSYRKIRNVFKQSGLSVTRYQGRMFLHHFIFSSIINNP